MFYIRAGIAFPGVFSRPARNELRGPSAVNNILNAYPQHSRTCIRNGFVLEFPAPFGDVER